MEAALEFKKDRFNGRVIGDGVALLVMLAGAALRAIHFLDERDLWLDEAMLALNIVGRDFGGLLQPLELNQAAPIGFLFLLKLATLALGPSEFAFRIFPFLASLATLPLFYLLVRAVLGVRGGLLALVLLAVSPTGVEYAGEAKQYSFDLLAAIAVLLSAEFYLRGEKPGPARVGLALAGSLTLLFSHGVIFVTASAGLALLLREIALRRWPELKKLALAGGVVLAAGLVDYYFHLRHVAANEHFANYWKNSITWADPFSDRGMRALSESWHELLELLLGLHLTGLGILVLIGGLVALAFRRRAFWSAVIAVPPLAVTVAALVDRYPFSDRLLLFLVPLLALGVAAGIDGLIAIRRWRVFVAGWILAWLVLGESVRHLPEDWDFLHPRRSREIQPALDYLRENIGPDDAIYVDGLAMPVYRFYTEYRAGYSELLRRETVYGPHQGKYEGTPAEKLEEFDNPPRIWLVFQYIKGDYQQGMIAYLDEMGTQIDLYRSRESRLYLFEL